MSVNTKIPVRATLKPDYFQNPDVVFLAKDLLGKCIITHFREGITAGLISETEAYAGVQDRASHAFGGKITARNSVMYRSGGCAYVYLCYGIHELFNIVTNVMGIPHAVLIRGIVPIAGLDIMESRKGKKITKKSGSGPGNAGRCLGISRLVNGVKLNPKNGIWIAESDPIILDKQILTTPRIGVDYAGEDSLLPYRFVWQGGEEWFETQTLQDL